MVMSTPLRSFLTDVSVLPADVGAAVWVHDISIHGWSHSQSDPELKAATRTSYSQLRNGLTDVVRRWQTAGTFDPVADPEAVAELLTSITLGFVAQRALAGGADIKAHASALDSLSHWSSPGPVVTRTTDDENTQDLPHPAREGGSSLRRRPGASKTT
jgi:BetI-type transcriptional repressor, C-terminal